MHILNWAVYFYPKDFLSPWLCDCSFCLFHPIFCYLGFSVPDEWGWHFKLSLEGKPHFSLGPWAENRCLLGCAISAPGKICLRQQQCKGLHFKQFLSKLRKYRPCFAWCLNDTYKFSWEKISCRYLLFFSTVVLSQLQEKKNIIFDFLLLSTENNPDFPSLKDYCHHPGQD